MITASRLRLSGFVRAVIERIIDNAPSDNMMWLMVGYMLGAWTVLGVWAIGYTTVRILQLLLVIDLR